MSVNLWLKELRAPFFTASIIPVILGALAAFIETGLFNSIIFILTLAGILFLHAGTNIVNDFFDYKSRTDIINKNRTPFSGGSGLLANGRLNPSSVYKTAIYLFAIGGLIGIYLAFLRGPLILVLGLIGIISGYFYTSPGINLSARGIGEVLVGLNFGVLAVMGSYYVQAQFFSLFALFVSLPVAFLITAVLYINEFPDYDADKDTGKKHLVVRLGRKRAVKVYEILIFLAYFSILLGIITTHLPLPTALSFLTIPLAIKSTKILRKYHSSFPEIIPANATTVLNHLFTGILLIAGLALSLFI